MGSGVYMQQVDLPASQGAATVYLVCRNGVTNEQAGKITPNPLRLRFWITYQAGESKPMLDVLTFCGNKGNTAQFPPYGLSTAPAAAARHLRCQNAR